MRFGTRFAEVIDAEPESVCCAAWIFVVLIPIHDSSDRSPGSPGILGLRIFRSQGCVDIAGLEKYLMSFCKLPAWSIALA